MKVARVVITNHSRLGDTALDIGDNAVLIGANDVGKSSFLRMLNLILGCSTAQLYQSLSVKDLRQTDRPLIAEVTFDGLCPEQWTVFPQETTIDPVDHSSTLTIRMEVEADPADPESLTVRRWFPDSGSDRMASREQLLALGWRYLPASRTASAKQLDGPDSALQTLLDALDLGEEQNALRALLSDFNHKLKESEVLDELRDRIAQHLSKAMPSDIEKDELVIRTASDPTASVLRDVSMFFDRAGEHVPISHQSDGIRQLLLMTLFDLAEDSSHTVAIDEPELHLHPSSQRTVAELLKLTKNQKLLVTHSPYIVQRFDPSEVVAITPDGACHQIASEKRSQIDRVLAHWWSPRLLEVLTARHVVVVEGVADRIVVEGAARASGLNLDRISTVVFEIDGADKFPNVYKLIGPGGFNIPLFGLVDDQEKGRWLGAVGGKPKNVFGKKVWVCDPDLEAEYCEGLSPAVVARALIDAGVCREQAVLQACAASSIDGVTAEAMSNFCRNNKVAAAVAVVGKFTRENVRSCGALGALVEALATIGVQE